MKNPSTLTQKMLFVFLPFSAGYFLSYVYRSTNAILAPYLNQDLGINAEQLGLITSVYYLTFALIQLPLGILIDKYGEYLRILNIMTTLTILYLIFAKNATIEKNNFITPAIMRKILYVRAIKNKVWSYISKVFWKDF